MIQEQFRTRKDTINRAAVEFATHFIDTDETYFYGHFIKEEGLDRAEQRGFIAGADWADNNPVLPWINVEDDLPCNHEDMTYPNSGGFIKFTQIVIVQDENGKVDVSGMFGENGVWKWSLRGEWKYWMPVSALEAFTRK